MLALSGNKTSTNKAKIAEPRSDVAVQSWCSKVSSVLRMKLRNANPAARVTGTDELTGTANYFIGNDPAKWRDKFRPMRK